MVLDEHVDAVVAGGHAEVMLTHDSLGSPYCVPQVEEVLRRNVRDNPVGWPAASLTYADEGMARIWSLAERHDPGNVRILDLDTLTSAED